MRVRAITPSTRQRNAASRHCVRFARLERSARDRRCGRRSSRPGRRCASSATRSQCAAKWLAPGTISRRCAARQCPVALRFEGDADGLRPGIADCRGWFAARPATARTGWRAVTTSHRFSPHRPLSRRRRATSATASCPRSGLVARFQVDGRAQAQRIGGRLRQDMCDSQRIQASFMATPCSVAPRRDAGRLPVKEGCASRHGMAYWGGRRLCGCLEPGRRKSRGMAGGAGARLFRQAESVRTVTIRLTKRRLNAAEAIDSFGFYATLCHGPVRTGLIRGQRHPRAAWAPASGAGLCGRVRPSRLMLVRLVAGTAK